MRIGFQSTGCGFDSLTVCGSVFVFIAHPAAHNSLLVDNVFPFFSRFECLCVLFVCDFSVFLASKNVGNPNEYKKKNNFCFLPW